MAATHVAQLVVVGTVDGQDYRNIIHFGRNDVINDADLAAALLALAQAWFECMITVLLPGLSNNIRLTRAQARQIFPVETDFAEFSTGQGFGPLATHSLPSHDATLVRIKTGGGGRRGAGRFFLPPPLETHVAGSIIDGDGQALILAFLACVAGKFVLPGATEDWHIGVLSRKSIVQGSVTIGDAFRAATQLTMVANVKTQRRRMVGKGS